MTDRFESPKIKTFVSIKANKTVFDNIIHQKHDQFPRVISFGRQDEYQ